MRGNWHFIKCGACFAVLSLSMALKMTSSTITKPYKEQLFCSKQPVSTRQRIQPSVDVVRPSRYSQHSFSPSSPKTTEKAQRGPSYFFFHFRPRSLFSQRNRPSSLTLIETDARITLFSFLPFLFFFLLD
ncbi:hypothetical protein BDB00DRAFT_819486 [Zychaea mexicana]|uniref:uncharacterized protein n=1 Tax=Zychaea mexicana TaxID=64656 RepID=UPI0022FDFBF5|nr:uncharacterized protein BDB00DRAFT_819486 [Zychaea mexicana]KAI9494273.1 hypothetical protein BDB00DRAFT_819486 [Zychaea mexicana]